MAKRRGKQRQPTTNDGGTRLASNAEVRFRGRPDAKRTSDDPVLNFAEDLGRLLGTAQAKAEGWLGQRKAIAEQLAQIRDTANNYLQQLTGRGLNPADAPRRGRRRRASGQTGQSSATGAGKRRGRKMTAAQRKAVGERMKKYWAERRKTTTGGKSSK